MLQYKRDSIQIEIKKLVNECDTFLLTVQWIDGYGHNYHLVLPKDLFNPQIWYPGFL